MRRSYLVVLILVLAVFFPAPTRAGSDEEPTSGGCWVWKASVPMAHRGRPLFESDGVSRRATLRLDGKVSSLRLAQTYDVSWWTSEHLTAKYTAEKVSVDVKLIGEPCPKDVPEGACESVAVRGTLTISRNGHKHVVKVSGGCGT
jgi:hypothetical protein